MNHLKHVKHMIGCVAMVAAVAIVFLARGGDAPGWLPVLLVLCCPLMMIAMMVMMSRESPGGADRSRERDMVRDS